MKKILILPFAAIIFFAACTGTNETKEDENATVARGYETLEERSSFQANVLQATKPSPANTYWYECDYYGKCWDSEAWNWYDCYYNAFDPKCMEGSYWEPEAFGGPDEPDPPLSPPKEPSQGQIEAACCNSWGSCYDEKGNEYKDPVYLESNYYDECGNGYDYYGNYTDQDLSYKDDYWCSQYYQYENVYDWDNCGNAYSATGEFLFYDNFYYDWQTCNNDYSACEGSEIIDIPIIDPDLTGSIGLGDPNDQRYFLTDYVDECGNGYDYYGNYTEYDDTYYDQARCDEYYKYENVDYWDYCGNSFDTAEDFLFYDNFEYDYKNCDQYGYGFPKESGISELSDLTESDEPSGDLYDDLAWTLSCDTFGNCKDANGASYTDPFYMVTEYTDECGNAYDYYGNYTEYDANAYVKDICDRFYQYDTVDHWDNCGNARSKDGSYLFYDNDYYDWKACNEIS